MATDQELNELSQKLISMDLSAQLQMDTDKWADTLAVVDDDKKETIKRMMLLIGSGNLEVFGNKLENGQVKQASNENNDLPVSFYMSGHGGRVYMSFEDGNSEQVLDWVTSGDKASNQGIHKGSYTLPGNRGGNLKDKEVVYDRHSATHSAKIKGNGEVDELKGASYGITGMLERMFNSINPFASFSHSQHLGMNVPFGGTEYKNIKANVKDDGSSGHLYINVGKGFIGIGMEGTAPRTEGPLGAHSTTGAADRFTPGEGQKLFVKFDAKDANFIAYLNDLIAQKPELWDKIKKEQYVVDKNSKNFIDRIIDKIAAFVFGEKVELAQVENVKDIAKLTKAAQCHIMEELGLNVLKDEKGNNVMVSTTLGTQLMDAGMTVPYNYNGQKIKFSNDALDKVLNNNEKIPDEIIYFKPQDNLEKFMAQAPVFANIDNKPLIKENPQLSLNKCFALSLAYDSDKNFKPANLEEAMKHNSFKKAEEATKGKGVGEYNEVLGNLNQVQSPSIKSQAEAIGVEIASHVSKDSVSTHIPSSAQNKGHGASVGI